MTRSTAVSILLRDFITAAFEGRATPVGQIRAVLAEIEDADSRRLALDRLQGLLICASVMMADPLNYRRTLRRTSEELIQFLRTTCG
jgi:hypothetical protein